MAFDGNDLSHASVSSTGILVYSTAVAVSRTDLAIVDRAGRTLQTIAESVLIEGGIALSHDGKRLAASVTADGGRDTDVWIYDLERRTAAPLTFEAGGERLPIWSFDDRHVLYVNDGKNDGVVFRRIMAASVEPGDEFHAGPPRERFRAHFSTAGSVNRDYRAYAPFPDGQRFVVDVMKERSATLLTLVTNWNSR